ncbi:MAG: hypothetical protein ABF876_12840, partial [Acetobacter aceti]
IYMYLLVECAFIQKDIFQLHIIYLFGICVFKGVKMPEMDFGHYALFDYLNFFHKNPMIPATITAPAIFLRLQQPFFAGAQPPVLQSFLAIKLFPETSVKTMQYRP